MTLLTITVSSSELELIAAAIGRTPDAKPARAPRKVAPAFTPVVVIDTGDPGLDAWMRRQYDRGVKPYVAKPLPKPAPLKPKKWTAKEIATLADFNRAAVAAWRRLGHEVIVEGNRGEIQGDGGNVRVLPISA